MFVDDDERTAREHRMVDKTTETDDRKLKVVKQKDLNEKNQSNESFDKMKLIKENLFLLSEIDKLKQSNRSMSQRIYYLESIVRMPAKNANFSK